MSTAGEETDLPLTEGRAFARAGLLGNPSDGYGGRTISLILRNFEAVVTLEESSDLRIEPRREDHDHYRDIDHLISTISRQGYYGGARLIKAAIKLPTTKPRRPVGSRVVTIVGKTWSPANTPPSPIGIVIVPRE